MFMKIYKGSSSDSEYSLEHGDSVDKLLNEHKWTTVNTPTNLHNYPPPHKDYIMEVFISVVCIVGLIVVFCLLCSCCRRNKNRGQVLSPPPAASSDNPAPYPQQQYTIAAYPVAHTMTAVHTAAPYPAAPYPAGTGAYPMPTVGPSAAGGAPYPTGGAPYPGVAPYPTAGAPYPTGGAPYPMSTPTAPDGNALPPSYDQAMGGVEKQLPYNPNAPR